MLANIESLVAGLDDDAGDDEGSQGAPSGPGSEDGGTQQQRTITIDLQPVTAGLATLNASVQQQTQQVVAGLTRIETRTAAVEAAANSTTLEVRRMRAEMPTRG